MGSPSMQQWSGASRQSWRVAVPWPTICLIPPLVAMPCTLARGQTPPNAGTILQQMERGNVPRLPGRDEKPRAHRCPKRCRHLRA